MDNESYKLVTRRYLSWGLAGVASIALLFAVIFGACAGNDTLLFSGLSALIAELAGVTGYYLGRRESKG
ncbi:hypothetical protein ES708_23795 [subsurface metagenome]